MNPQVSYRAFPMNKYVAQRKVRQAKSLLGGDEEADAETQALVEKRGVESEARHEKQLAELEKASRTIWEKKQQATEAEAKQMRVVGYERLQGLERGVRVRLGVRVRVRVGVGVGVGFRPGVTFVGVCWTLTAISRYIWSHVLPQGTNS